MKRNIVIILSFLLFNTLYSQVNTPFTKGINLTSWFQTGGVGEIQFGKYNYDDFKDVKSLGIDVIRLPINLHFMTSGEPKYTIEPLFFQFLDTVVNWCEVLDMHLILDNHTFDPSIDTDPEIGVVLKKVWSQMATHYKDRGDFIYYEILNEPHGIEDDVWNTIQGEVIDEIRKHDSKHTIVVGPADWNNFKNLKKMPHYADEKLIYTFHFYDPFLFTHQGASWIEPSMVDVANIPFPYKEETMPNSPEVYEGTWIEDTYKSYASFGTQENLETMLQVAIDFSKARNVPIFCGEFGVLKTNCENQDLINWYKIVTDYLALNDVSWTMWGYHGSFGAFEKEGPGLFNYDLNVGLLEAMGLTPPEQLEYIKSPDSLGFSLYHDYVENTMFTSAYSIDSLNYYNENDVNNGQFCIESRNMPQYAPITFDFRLEKDLSGLKDNAYAIDFMIRCNRDSKPIDIRFVDTYILDGEDIPWRMHVTINNKHYKGDLAWHHVHIPLSSFVEMGGHDGEWHSPIGAFDWTAIDKFEIVAETEVGDATFWFDNIHITNLDTALVYHTTLISDPYPAKVAGVEGNTFRTINLYPNPSQGAVTITLPNSDSGKLQLFNMQGQKVYSKSFIAKANLPMDLSALNPGIYLIEVNGLQNNYVERIYLIP